ncbi:G-protein coupled receptor moody isoform X2 [Aethina tumida]|uniref:G-protein coupled receptor moody isoform X2 n=1 Tax=Aethina tumida TaxID=116153 RepID=UPI002148E568|nr:G-protein coupled receptor moody isoform X2 [Aethina tumida]
MSNETHYFLRRFSPVMMTIAGVFTIVIMIVGVVGNMLTVAALLRHSKIRTVAAAFIASLCISDLLFCFMVLPFSASQFFHGTWIHGDILCTIIPVLRYASIGVSLLSIAIISINRYILIAWPHLYSKIYTKTKVICYIGFIWLFSYGIQIPILMGKWGCYGFDEKLGTCSIKKDENGNSAKTALFVIGFAFPCILIVISYANIFYTVRKSHQRLQQHSTGSKYKRSEMKITKMVLVIFICFLVCYLPITLVKIFDDDVKHAPLHVLGYLLIYMSSCVNPVVYVTMNKQYRQAYLDTLMCKINSPLDSQNTPAQPNSRSHMTVTYLKNMVSPSPKA